jgi:SAM-dependent methyltransferase
MRQDDVLIDAPPGPVAGDTALQSFTLESLASAVNYHRWVEDLAAPHLGADPLEVGSGLGDYAAAWVRRGQPRVTVSDADPGRLAHLRSRFPVGGPVQVRELDVTSGETGSYSAVIAINVLEHIEDDVAALRAMADRLQPGGKVIIFVPAFPFAMSRFDRAVGHFRRYRKHTLAKTFTDAGLDVDRVRYVNAPGLLAWFVGMRVLRMTPQDGATVRLWDRFVIPLARTAEARRQPPFGQSVFGVGVKR